MAAHALDARRSLYLVQVGQTILVVGAGAAEMNILHTVKDPGEVQALRKELELSGSEGAFEGALASAFDREAGNRTVREGREAVDRARQAIRGIMEKLGGKKQ